MKKLLSLILCCTLVFSLSANVFAAETYTETSINEPIRISRSTLNEIRGNTPAMSEKETAIALDFINEKAKAEKLNNDAIKTRYNRTEVAARTARINTIESELEAMGVIPLTVEEIYKLHGRTYRPGAPGEPSDTNYVKFYSMTSYIDDYEVYSIVAYSSGASQSNLNVPFYTDGTITLYDTDSYVEADFREYIDVATSAAGTVFEETFERLPVLNYLGDVWDIATYFNPTATQRVTIDYDCQQTFVYSYVAESSVGYFDFMQTAERKQGSCVMAFRQYQAGSSTLEQITGLEYEVLSRYYADYDHAVQLYQQGGLQQAYRVGNIEFELDGALVDDFSMPYYNSIWNIPGV